MLTLQENEYSPLEMQNELIHENRSRNSTLEARPNIADESITSNNNNISRKNKKVLIGDFNDKSLR